MASSLPSRPRAQTLQRSAEATERVARHLDNEFRRPVTARELSDVAYLSEFELQRSFGRTLGLTVGSYLRRRRTEHAMQLLASTSLGLEAIARRVGLSGASALVHLFKRETGLTPGAFRAQTPDTISGYTSWVVPWEESTRQDSAAPLGQLRVLDPIPVLCHKVRGQSGRSFAHVGFASADRLLSEFRRLWPGQAPPPIYSIYPEQSLAPSDPSSHMLLAVPTGFGRPMETLGTDFELDHIAGGPYLIVASPGDHRFAWHRWSLSLRSGLFERFGVIPRPTAFPFELCDGFMGEGEGKVRLNERLAFPVLPRNATAMEVAHRAELDSEALRCFRPVSGRLFDRLHQLPR